MNNWITTLKQNILFLRCVYIYFLCPRIISVHADFPTHREIKDFFFFFWTKKTREALLTFPLHAFCDETVMYRGKQNGFQATIFLVFERNWMSESSGIHKTNLIHNLLLTDSLLLCRFLT